MHVGYEVRQRRLARPLRVSHTTVEHVWVARLRAGTGVGECAIGPWTDENPDTVGRSAAEAVALMPGTPTVPDVDRSVRDGALSRLSATARMLAEMALLDFAAIEAGEPLWRLLGLQPPAPVPLWRTVSVGEPAGEAPGTRVKVKLGGPQDGAVLDALAGTAGQVIVDVNRGWTRAQVLAYRERLRRVPLVALEDPVADPAALPAVRAALPGVPVLLDEGVRTVAQAENAARDADGANVKLVKFGGLLAADRALRRLGELGARRMLGCFVEPPRAIAYAAQLAGRAEWADLDGHLLLDGGPRNGVLELDSSAPGIPRVVGAEGDA